MTLAFFLFIYIQAWTLNARRKLTSEPDPFCTPCHKSVTHRVESDAMSSSAHLKAVENYP